MLWNELGLNAPWSVGYVSDLIESRPFANKEAWRDYYYASGEKRNEGLVKLPEPTRDILQQFHPTEDLRQKIRSLAFVDRRWNYQFGRTREDLAAKGRFLYRKLQEREATDITVEECIAHVRFRVVAETWNGLMVREKAAVAWLKQSLPSLEVRKTPGAFDYRYSVDYELYQAGKLVCGIQVKPASYQGKGLHLERARSANQRKQGLYFEEFGKPVFDMLMKGNAPLDPGFILKVKACFF